MKTRRVTELAVQAEPTRTTETVFQVKLDSEFLVWVEIFNLKMYFENTIF